MTFKHILFPVDRFEKDHPVQTRVIEMALAFDAEVTVVHSYEFMPVLPVFVDTPYVHQTELESYLSEQSHALIDAVTTHLSAKGIRCHSHSLKGEAGHSIVALAQASLYDVIIMGCREFGQIKRFVMGSVSQYVLHHAHCPVLVVPDPETPG